MVRVGVYDQMKKALQDLIAPELHAMRGDMQGMRGEIRMLDQKIDGVDARFTTKIDGLDARLTTKIEALDQKIDGFDARLTAKIDALDQKIDGVDARLTVKIDALDDKIDGLDDKIDGLDVRVTTKIDSLRGELVAEVRRARRDRALARDWLSLQEEASRRRRTYSRGAARSTSWALTPPEAPRSERPVPP